MVSYSERDQQSDQLRDEKKKQQVCQRGVEHLEACDGSCLVGDCCQAVEEVAGQRLANLERMWNERMSVRFFEKFVLELWSVRTRRGAGNRTHQCRNR